MKTTWKFPFEIMDHIEISMPEGAEFLVVAEQRGQGACMWCLVDPRKPQKIHHFQLRGTGHPFDGTEGRFLGTFQLLGGGLVFHLFTDKTHNEEPS